MSTLDQHADRDTRPELPLLRPAAWAIETPADYWHADPTPARDTSEDW
jgi:hypothetical protein